jgi:hypothetical protein
LLIPQASRCVSVLTTNKTNGTNKKERTENSCDSIYSWSKKREHYRVMVHGSLRRAGAEPVMMDIALGFIDYLAIVDNYSRGLSE